MPPAPPTAENIMLAYFGEEATRPCGHCDVCRKRKPDQSASPETVMKCILEITATRPQGIDFRILSHMIQAPPAVVARMISFLCGEGFLTVRDGLYYPVESKKLFKSGSGSAER